MKKYLFALLGMGLVVQVSAADLPQGAIRTGTLGSPILVHDAMPIAVLQAHTMGCDKVVDGRFFVEQDPTGEVGKRVWKEIWQTQCNNGNYNVGMTFMEAPDGGVSYVVSNH